jgi:hypothetical protein
MFHRGDIMKKEIKGFIIGVIATILLSGGAYAAYGTITGQFNNDVTVNGTSIDGNVVIIDGELYIKKADIISYLNALNATEQAQSQTTAEPAVNPTGTPQSTVTPATTPTATPQPTATPTPQPTATPQPTPNIAGYQTEYDMLTATYNQTISRLNYDWKYYYDDYMKWARAYGEANYMVQQKKKIFDEQAPIITQQINQTTTKYNADVAALKTKYGIQ